MLGIPQIDKQGQEVIIKWRLIDAGLSSDSAFYTDSNGLEMQKRILNYRETFDLDTDMQVSSNYYPINSAIVVKSVNQNDSQIQMTVMNDRAQGGSSLQPGTIELMQNRRLFFDDNRGVDEPLNEVDPQTN